MNARATLLLMALVWMTSCYVSQELPDKDTGSDSDADTDTDTASDTDSDTDSDTGSDTGYDTDYYDCTAEYIYYDNWWGIYYHHGDFAGQCVDSSTECDGDISPSDPTGTCPSSQECCIPICLYGSGYGYGWCQHLGQLCTEPHEDIQSICGEGMLCCPPIPILI